MVTNDTHWETMPLNEGRVKGLAAVAGDVPGHAPSAFKAVVWSHPGQTP